MGVLDIMPYNGHLFVSPLASSPSEQKMRLGIMILVAGHVRCCKLSRLSLSLAAGTEIHALYAGGRAGRGEGTDARKATNSPRLSDCSTHPRGRTEERERERGGKWENNPKKRRRAVRADHL